MNYKRRVAILILQLISCIVITATIFVVCDYLIKGSNFSYLHRLLISTGIVYFLICTRDVVKSIKRMITIIKEGGRKDENEIDKS